MADVPGENQVLEAAVAGEVNSLLVAFTGYLGYAAIAIPVWILFLLGLPALSDYYASLKKAVDFTNNNPRMVEFMYGEGLRYLADKPSEGPASGDVLDWARTEWTRGEDSPFYVYLQTRISSLVDDSTQIEKKILNWTGVTLLVLFTVLFLVAFLVG